MATAPTKTITVQGRCVGRPVLIEGLFNVRITGIPPAGGCPADGPRTTSLTSTISRQQPPFAIRSGSNGEVFKVRNCSRVTIEFLNIRDGRPQDLSQNHDDGLDYKGSTGGLVYCNCVINNEEGIDVDAGSCNQVLQNLVTENENGIRVSGGTKSNLIRSNTASNNGAIPIEGQSSDPSGRHDGLILSQSATLNSFEMNVASGNADEGLQLIGVKNNCVVNNSIGTNGGDPLAADPPGTGACEIVTSSTNKIDCNTMVGNVARNGSTPSDLCRLVSGTANTGSNVPGGPACVSASCPAPACTITPIP